VWLKPGLTEATKLQLIEELTPASGVLHTWDVTHGCSVCVLGINTVLLGLD